MMERSASPRPALTGRLTDLSEMAARRADWLMLMAEAIEPNPFFGPDYLMASERCLHPENPISVLVVEQGRRLVGLLPLTEPKLLDGLLGRAWQIYANPFTCLGTPLLARDFAPEALTAAITCLAGLSGPHRLHLANMPLDGAMAALLADTAKTRALPLRQANSAGRALATASGPQPSTARAKQLRRKRKRLEELGPVSITQVDAGEPGFSHACAQFLALEASGWKGAAGTALGATAATRAFAEQAFVSQARILALSLAGRPIAMILLLLGRETGYSVKVAYDEAFAAFSPGNLLDAACLDLLGPESGLLRLDSCALPGHPVEALWREQVMIGDLVLGLTSAVPAFSVSLISGALEASRRLRALRHARSYTTRPIAAKPMAARDFS